MIAYYLIIWIPIPMKGKGRASYMGSHDIPKHEEGVGLCSDVCPRLRWIQKGFKYTLNTI